MKLNTNYTLNLFVLILAIFSFASCSENDPLDYEVLAALMPPSINTSPGNMTVDLLGENNTCSKVITLHYNITDSCPRSGEITASIDAPGLVNQTEVDTDGNIYFDIEICALDPDLIVTMTATDACGNQVSDQIEITVNGESCVSFFCQKFEYAFDSDATLEVNSNGYSELTGMDNLCDHIDVKISYSGVDVNDTLMVYDCEIISLQNHSNIEDSLFYWANDQLIESCRIVVFISNDPNGDGDFSDGWSELCGL